MKKKTRTESRIKSDDRKIVACDRPYKNFNFHRECYEKIKNMHKFVQDTYELWYN